MDVQRLLGTRGCRRQGCGVSIQNIQAQSIFGVVPIAVLLRPISYGRSALSQPGPNIECHRRAPCAHDSASE